QRTAGIAVQETHGGQQWRAQAEARRQQVVDDAAGIARRAGVSDRLVEQQHHARRRIERLAVSTHLRMPDLLVGVEHLAVGIRDAAFAEHARHVLAAAVAEIGDQLHQFHRPAHRATASTTLKPSRWTTVRTLPKLASSTLSYGRWRLGTSHRRLPGCSAAAAAAMNARPMSTRSPAPCAWNGGLVTMAS